MQVKAWQKITPNTIEAWLISPSERDQQLAQEALQALGKTAARDYLSNVLRKEHQQKDNWRISIVVANTAVMVFSTILHLWLKELHIATAVASFLSLIVLFSMYTLQDRATQLQKKIAEHIFAKPTVEDIEFLWQTCQNIGAKATYNRMFAVLPSLLRQITPKTKHLLPDPFWQRTVTVLDAIARDKKENFFAGEIDLLKAQIEVCGNTRHEPALPALEALATRSAKSASAIELKELAAHYVAIWHANPTALMPSVAAGQQTRSVGRWYAA